MGMGGATEETEDVGSTVSAADRGEYRHAKPASPRLFKARLFVASHGYHNGDHEPGSQDSEHNIIEGCHTITAKKKAAR